MARVVIDGLISTFGLRSTLNMQFTQKQYFPFLALAILSIPLFFLNIYDVHSWGDDFAQYIKEALNIAHGKRYYLSGYVYNPYNTEYAPPQYPPGYPLLLAPVVKMWGISYRAMAYFNTCITAGLLFALFAYFRKHAGKVAAVCIAVLITYSGYILGLKANVLADLSCLLCIVLYLGARNTWQFSRKRILLLIVLTVSAMLMRSQAGLLLVAEGLYLLLSMAKKIVKERKINIQQIATHPSVLITFGGILLFLLIDKVVFYTPVKTSAFYNQFIERAIHRPLMDSVKDNIVLLTKQLTMFFHYDTARIFPTVAMSVMESAALVFVILGFIISVMKRLAVDDVFFMLMCLLVLYLPVHDLRYFLPAIPLLFYYCYTSLRIIVPAIAKTDTRAIAIGITLFYLYIGSEYLQKAATIVPAGCIPHPKDLAAFSYIKNHVKDDEIIVFVKPRLLTLYTDKRAINTAWQVSPAKNKAILDSLQVTYMLVVDGLDDPYFKTYLRETQHPLDSTRIATGYTLYRLR